MTWRTAHLVLLLLSVASIRPSPLGGSIDSTSHKVPDRDGDSSDDEENGIFLNQWAVHIPSGRRDADQVASDIGFENLGQVKWRSLRRAQIAVLVVTVAAVIYNIPRFLEREVVVSVTCQGHVTPKIRKTTLRNDRHYFLIYKTLCYFVFRSIGPLITLLLLNVRLVRTLRVVHLRHSALSRNMKQRENLTSMLVGVVFVFIVCQLPDLGIRIAFTGYEFASGTVRLDMTALKYANSASNALLTLNSSVNFFVYCFLGRKFRRILLQWLCCDVSQAAGHLTAAADVRPVSNHILQREHAVRLNSARLNNISNRQPVEVSADLKNTAAVQRDDRTKL